MQGGGGDGNLSQVLLPGYFNTQLHKKKHFIKLLSRLDLTESNKSK